MIYEMSSCIYTLDYYPRICLHSYKTVLVNKVKLQLHYNTCTYYMHVHVMHERSIGQLHTTNVYELSYVKV